ncbi:ATP synthase F1 [Beauveria bassiana ARSEF 2860]|uniref:Serine protease n=1 Tax=Beauveria bassiana (strain ARSEF 2860) TaxID=655819 RepID=J4UHK2_BEAB2|nr:ATP synthase F1 [Beauveria bassiana ARSEF 2860]EJP62707.1 ATP synthase F1 [Beauveria bassiana ARSEF 2860]
MSKFINDTKNFELAAPRTREDMSAQFDKTDDDKVSVEQAFPISSRTDRMAVDKNFDEISSGGAGDFRKDSKDRPPESQSATDRLATWSLNPDLKQESPVIKMHPDDFLGGRDPIQDSDRRTRVDVQDFEDNGKYRSVVKIQSLWRYNGTEIWTMGTGWLIRDDLVVTAGHNVYSDTYGGQALRIKCWIGYRGRDLANDPRVQHRNAMNIVTTEAWRSQSADRKRHDVAMIQVDAPFMGNLRLFNYINTPSPQISGSIVLVGYSGDKSPERNEEDIGGWMYEGRCPARYDLAESSHMIEHKVDTYGGQSGAPILLSDYKGMVAIGTHCYNGSNGSFSSGNPIGGQYGNNYDEFVKRFRPSTKKTIPLGDFTPKVDPPKSDFAYYKGGNPTDDKEDDFYHTEYLVLHVGLEEPWEVGTLRGPIGTLCGPIGTLLGVITGGIIGVLAKSVVLKQQEVSFSVPNPAMVDACFQRAQLAEAALQCTFRVYNGHGYHSWMASLWNTHHLKSITNSKFRALVTPIINDFGLRLAADHWQKRMDPNPATRHVKAGNNSGDDLKLTKTEAYDPSKKVFVEAFFEGRTRRVDGYEKESAETLASWLSMLFDGAVNSAHPIASAATETAIDHIVKLIGGIPRVRSIPADAQDADIDILLKRAVIADVALQDLEGEPKWNLEHMIFLESFGGLEGGTIMDGIKVVIQQGGPDLVDIAQKVVAKHLPGIIKRFKNGKRNPHYTVSGGYDDDDAVPGPEGVKKSDADGYVDENPDAPPIERFSPAERDEDTPPIEHFSPVEPK